MTMTFTQLELAALHSIFAETPELASGLEGQLAMATVAERTNSGGGFFTEILVPDDTPRVNSPSVLGHETHARIAGLEHGFGFVLFMKDGRLDQLEGYTYAESTASLALTTLTFEVFNAPANRQG